MLHQVAFQLVKLFVGELFTLMNLTVTKKRPNKIRYIICFYINKTKVETSSILVVEL